MCVGSGFVCVRVGSGRCVTWIRVWGECVFDPCVGCVCVLDLGVFLCVCLIWEVLDLCVCEFRVCVCGGAFDLCVFLMHVCGSRCVCDQGVYWECVCVLGVYVGVCLCV